MARWILLMAAVVATVATVLLTRSYLSGRERQLLAEHAVTTTEVLVTATGLEVGQTVSERTLVWQRWPSDNLHPRYVTRDKQPDAIRRLTGAAARQPLYAGEPVTDAKLVKREGASVLAVTLREGYRAVTIRVDEAQGLAGLVRPGDQVDVILAHKVAVPGEFERGEREVAEVIAGGVRVLGVGQDIKSADDKSKVVKSITVEVTPPQAEAVALGRVLGSLSLSLRSAFADAELPDRPHAYTSTDDISAALREQRRSGPVMLVAGRSLPAGSLLAEADIVWVPANAEADPEALFVQDRVRPIKLRGALITQAALKGEPILRHHIVQPSEARFVPLALRPGQRAVSIVIAASTAVGGFIAAGDQVDVIFVDDVDDQAANAQLRKRSWSETVVEGVRVLSIESTFDAKAQHPQVGGTATLETSPTQAEAIALAASMGKLSLALRPAEADGTAVATGGASVGRAGPPPTASGAVGLISPQRLDPSHLPNGFTVDRSMSRGLDAIVRGDDRAGSIVIYRGTEPSTIPLRALSVIPPSPGS
jgi:pilus assembly protein CpaB